MRTVSRVYDDYADAVAVVTGLEAAADVAPNRKISMITNENAHGRDTTADTTRTETKSEAGPGAGVGAIVGGGGGLLTAVAAAIRQKAPKEFRVCAPCHSLRPDLNITGPSLAGIWGRKSGSLAGFDRYSPALPASRTTWDASSLDALLTNPAPFIPDNWMTFAGIPDAQTRADLIAFLRGISATRNWRARFASAERLHPNAQEPQTAFAGPAGHAIRSCRDSCTSSQPRMAAPGLLGPEPPLRD